MKAKPVPDPTDSDPGLFGPFSQTWRLHADPMMGIAGLRALLLQALHPQAAIGLGQNTNFYTDVWGRLGRTAEYVGRTTFGSTAEALTLAARVRAGHSAMTGTDPVTGREFRLDEPGPLLWVHCCLVASVVEVLDRSGTELTAAQADSYIAEQVRSAALVGLEPEAVPQDRAGLDRYFREIQPELRITDFARKEASIVIAMPLPLPLAPLIRPAWSAVSGLAFAALPRWARRMYCIPHLPGAAGLHDSATTLALRSVRASLRGAQSAIPALREGPHLRAAKARLSLVQD